MLTGSSVQKTVKAGSQVLSQEKTKRKAINILIYILASSHLLKKKNHPKKTPWTCSSPKNIFLSM